ncbi:putative nepenthesin [Lupinus albus]|uniref:Putative nepenthesin n=1 Tax=Lupinus albus TaxID=3870 RepID=A0A6A4MZ78_LUPAL|nr:putative nepenthesin [Lupinus albus]
MSFFIGTFPKQSLAIVDTGIFGLGGGPSSFISQHGAKFGKRKFSYCLLPFYYVQGSSKLKFGVDTQTNRTGIVTTSLVKKLPTTFYYLSLESVSINGKVVLPNESVFGNIIIDSGTTATFLKTSWYEKIQDALLEAIGAQSVVVMNAIPAQIVYTTFLCHFYMAPIINSQLCFVNFWLVIIVQL